MAYRRGTRPDIRPNDGQGAVPYQQPAQAADAQAPEAPRRSTRWPRNWSKAISARLTPLSILEALLFVGRPDNGAIEADAVAGMMRGVRSAEIEQLAAELNEISQRKSRDAHRR